MHANYNAMYSICNVMDILDDVVVRKRRYLTGAYGNDLPQQCLPHTDVGIFPFFSVEPQVLLFSQTMVIAFPILQQGARLDWFSIQN